LKKTFTQLGTDLASLLHPGHARHGGAVPNTGWKGFLFFWVRVGREFIENRCPVRAAALAFTTVLALVPVLAVGLSVSTAFAQKDSAQLKQWVNLTIETTVPQLKEIKEVGTLIDAIFQSIEKFKSGSLGVTAVLALVFMAISLLSSIETTFNDIWGVTKGRNWLNRVVQYWTTITLGPMLLLAAAGITTSAQLPGMTGYLDWLKAHDLALVARLIRFGAGYFLPFLLLSAALTAVYLLLPNAKVNWRAALLGGLVAGAIVQLNSMFNILYASRVARDKWIYGSLAVAPLFLVGLYFSWMIVLLGAQVACVFQNWRVLVRDRDAQNLSPHDRELLLLQVMTLVARRFQDGRKAPDAPEIAADLRAPAGLVGELLALLKEANVLVEASGTDGGGCLPARPLGQISLHQILNGLEPAAGSSISKQPDAMADSVRNAHRSILRAAQTAGETITLQHLVDSAVVKNPDRDDGSTRLSGPEPADKNTTERTG
jgi:membrane protein